MLKANRSGDETHDLRQKTLLYCHIIQKKNPTFSGFFSSNLFDSCGTQAQNVCSAFDSFKHFTTLNGMFGNMKGVVGILPV